MLFLLVVGDRGAWNQGAWGTHLVLPQGTTAVGDVLVPQDSVANLTGVSATDKLCNTFETQNGTQGTTAVGTVTVSANANLNLTGVSATGQVGNTFETQNGVSATGSIEPNSCY